MTTLDEARHRAATSLDRYTNYESTATEAEELQALNTELETDILPKLMRTLNSARALREHAEEAVAVDVASTTAALESLRAGLAASQSSRARRQAASALRNLKVQSQAAVQTAWNRYLTRLLPDVAGLNQLAETLEEVGVEADELTNVLKEALALWRTLPTADSVRSAATLPARVQSALSHSASDDPEVRQFLTQLAGGGARLSALTPRVDQWMEDLHIKEHFGIVARAMTKA